MGLADSSSSSGNQVWDALGVAPGSSSGFCIDWFWSLVEFEFEWLVANGNASLSGRHNGTPPSICLSVPRPPATWAFADRLGCLWLACVLCIFCHTA